MSKQLSNAKPYSRVESDRREADYQQYCREICRQRDECLYLLKSAEEASADGQSTRKAVVEHCRNYSVPERTFWYYLARYVEQRTFNLNDRPDALFQASDEYLRQQILLLIPRIPHRAFAECKKILYFTSGFLDRMTYLCDWLLSSFLEKTLEQDHSPVDEETLLDEELFSRCESIIINAIGVMQRSIGDESDDEEF